MENVGERERTIDALSLRVVETVVDTVIEELPVAVPDSESVSDLDGVGDDDSVSEKEGVGSLRDFVSVTNKDSVKVSLIVKVVDVPGLVYCLLLIWQGNTELGFRDRSSSQSTISRTENRSKVLPCRL